MPNIHGKNGYCRIIDAAGASANISGDNNQWDLSWTEAHPDFTAMGDPGIQRSSSALEDVKFTVAGWANDSASQNLDKLNTIKQQIALVDLGPNGSSTSSLKFSACLVLDDVAVGVPLKGIVTFKAGFSLGSGSLTQTTW